MCRPFSFQSLRRLSACLGRPRRGSTASRHGASSRRQREAAGATARPDRRRAAPAASARRGVPRRCAARSGRSRGEHASQHPADDAARAAPAATAHSYSAERPARARRAVAMSLMNTVMIGAGAPSGRERDRAERAVPAGRAGGAAPARSATTRQRARRTIVESTTLAPAPSRTAPARVDGDAVRRPDVRGLGDRRAQRSSRTETAGVRWTVSAMCRSRCDDHVRILGAGQS